MTTTLYSGTRLTMYPDLLTKPLRGEYIDYKFPISIVPIRYEIGFADEACPVKWYIFGRLQNGPWVLIDSKRKYNDFVIDTGFVPYGNTYSYDITTRYTVDTIRFHASVSTSPYIKLREFRVYDQFGVNIPFLVPFCTNTNSAQHSGSLNFSQIDSFSLNAPLQTDFYAVGHTILEIENGMCTNVI